MPRLIFAAVPLLLIAPAAPSQPRAEPAAPKIEPVAETKLLMAGFAKPNFDGLGRTLRDKPTTANGWAFARGQALLVAESANLLLMRPPSDRVAHEAWFARTIEMRTAALGVAKAAAAKDHLAARGGVAGLANACNRCHEAFQVRHRVVPFDPPE
ncbi:MAG: hypothetical protein ACRC7O_09320 [Fimbriiglobus sp.]